MGYMIILVGGFNLPLWKIVKSMGRMTTHIWNGKKSHVWNHQPVVDEIRRSEYTHWYSHQSIWIRMFVFKFHHSPLRVKKSRWTMTSISLNSDGKWPDHFWSNQEGWFLMSPKAWFSMVSICPQDMILWVKSLGTPKLWMVNTKLDIHICGPTSVFHFDPHPYDSIPSGNLT